MVIGSAMSMTTLTKEKMNKYTKVKEINKNSNYFKKKYIIYFINEDGNAEVIAMATSTLNAKRIMTALNLTEKLLNKKENA